MKLKEASNYYHKPCKFTLRSGKEIFGVIWKSRENMSNEHCFASAMEYLQFQKRMTIKDKDLYEKIIYKVNIEEVVSAKQVD